MTNYVGVPAEDKESLRAASPAWVLDAGVAPLYLFDTADDLMPGAQLDNMIAHLDGLGVTNYQSQRIAGNLHSFAFWPTVKTDALAFLAAHFGRPIPTPTPTPSPTATPTPTATPSPTATPTPTPTPSPTPSATPTPDPGCDAQLAPQSFHPRTGGDGRQRPHRWFHSRTERRHKRGRR